jgi:N-(2-amino-2-carboxyethyl)-L-glutamate synthase
VGILHDSGTRYLNTVFDDQWVAEHLKCSPAELAARVESDLPCAQGEPQECLL